MTSASSSTRNCIVRPFVAVAATWPDTPSPWICNAGSTLRSVTGSIGGMPGSAKRSTMPNGAAANLASGGMVAVFVFNGNSPALSSARPLSSVNPFGKVG